MSRRGSGDRAHHPALQALQIQIHTQPVNVVEQWVHRLVGLGAILWALGLLWLALNGTLEKMLGARDLSRVYLLVVAILALGLMSLLCQRLAGCALALGLGVFGLALTIGSIVSVALPWLWVNLAIGLIMVFPSILLIALRVSARKLQ